MNCVHETCGYIDTCIGIPFVIELFISDTFTRNVFQCIEIQRKKKKTKIRAHAFSWFVIETLMQQNYIAPCLYNVKGDRTIVMSASFNAIYSPESYNFVELLAGSFLEINCS